MLLPSPSIINPKNHFNSQGHEQIQMIHPFILQQSSMLSKNKYVSSLDLKYLDAKFIAIHDSQLEMHSNLNEIRKSKTTELPSIFKSIHDDDTTLYTSNVLPESRLDSIVSRPAVRYQSVDRSVEKSSQAEDEMSEVNKYKKLIAKIKTDNDLLHKEIINLYREEKLGCKEPKKKPIRTIIQPSKDFLTKSASALRLTETKQYQRVYQDLTNTDNPYRKQSLQLQKKFMNNNFHKNFQAFLLSRNKRVPQFIKNIR